MGSSGLLRGTLFILCMALVVLIFLPKDCAKQVPAAVGKLRRGESAPKGLHIESSTPPPSSRAVSYPAGLDAARLQYLVEIDPAFAAPKSATLFKQGRFENGALVGALQSLHYIETQPDGSYGLTREGLLNLNAADQGGSWTIPLAKRQFLRTDAVACSAGDQCAVTFAWQWQPNDVGTAMQPSISPHSGTAHLQGGAGQWAVSDVSVDEGW